jgi:hypothetical protein
MRTAACFPAAAMLVSSFTWRCALVLTVSGNSPMHAPAQPRAVQH